MRAIFRGFALALPLLFSNPSFAASQASGAPLASSGSPTDQPLVQMRRFALVVGSNNGGSGRERLKFAGSDAKSFAALMTELGGVRASDLTLLLDPKLAELGKALSGLRAAAADAIGTGARSELIFYYSGHSDETGILLGGEKLGYSELRSDLEGVNADLRVAILDSCSSGAMTRAKGGTSRPAFVFDESSDMKGHAYITSSSAAESAQESDRLGGSFFTHYLISGLRGAADTLGQGRVTLNEAYAYAFSETLASTEQTRFGAQHPAYEINLTGTGDLVLTDLRASTAGLILAADLHGRVFIRDARGILAVELSKAPGKRVEIGLAPGSYGVTVDDAGARFSAEAQIAKGRYALLSPSDFKPVSASQTVARGGPLLTGGGIIGIDTSILTIQALPDFGQPLFSSSMDRHFAVNALVGSTRELQGFEVAGLVNTDSLSMTGFQAAGLANAVLGSSKGFQAAGLVNYVGGDMSSVNAAGLVNYAGGRLAGAQLAGLFNVAQAGRVLYTGTESQGFVGELPARPSEATVGFQAAGLGNVVLGSFAGAQVAGIVNWASASAGGAQVSGILNRSRNLVGVQISVVNVAREIAGGQIGLVNVSGELRGAQFGLVNIAERLHGVSLGLVSIEKGGVAAIEGTSDLDGRGNVSLKIGTRFTYTIASVGVDSIEAPSDWNSALGLGLRIPLGGAFVDADAQWRYSPRVKGGSFSLASGSQTALGRILVGMRLAGPLALVGGISTEVLIPGVSVEFDGTLSRLLTWNPSFIFGLQL